MDEYFVLNNGVEIPKMGMGGWNQTRENILDALNAGYRMIDTAAQYGNEEEIGAAVRSSGISRQKIFLSTKLWTEDVRRRRTREAFEESLQRLGTDYVDLYLIHWPAEGFAEAWQDMETLYKEGKARAIGVSNFHSHHLDELKQNGAAIVPAINQIESHPFFSNQKEIDRDQEREIQAEAWCPIGGPGSGELTNETISGIAAVHNKTAAQIILRWHLQRGIVIIPKSSHMERMKSNIQIFDFDLNADEMDLICSLDAGKRLGANPDNFNF